MSDVTTGTLRATLLLLVVLGVVGVAVMLAYERHWDGVWQFVPWATLVGIIIALTALLVHTTQETVWLARGLAVVVIVVAVLGVWRHFDENYTTAPLDARYSESWETMSVGLQIVGGYEGFGWPCVRARRRCTRADRHCPGCGDHWH